MGENQVRPADDGPGWRAAATAARLGVATSTLRSWSRRYDLGPSGHQAGRHRYYTATDIARLEHMRALVASGIAPAEAARHSRADPVPAQPISGRAVHATAISNLVAAAHRLEAAAVAGALRHHLAQRGVINTWDQVCRPALAEINRMHRTQGGCIDAEHLLSWAMSSAMHQVTELDRAPGSRATLLACVTSERHTLALEALRAALAERGTPAHMLGADTPTAALLTAVARIRPEVLVVWAQTERAAQLSRLTKLEDGVHTPGLLIAAGPGWRPNQLPPGARRMDCLQDAVDAIQATDGPHG